MLSKLLVSTSSLRSCSSFCHLHLHTHSTAAGGAIGVYCKHLYEEDALAHTEAKLAAGGSSAYAAQLKLKNEDAVVAAVLSAAGLKVQCLRMLTFNEMWDMGPL